jgi:transposase-like protein
MRSPTTAPSAQRDLARFACPNADCALFNRFEAGNLHVVECSGEAHPVRRLYCDHCGQRFSERQGTLLEYTKLPEVAVVRVLKCLVHGCSVTAAADICDVDERTVERLLECAGRRAADFHRLHLRRLDHSPPAVQMDELHACVAPPATKKKGGQSAGANRGAGAAVRAVIGCMRPCR